MKTVNSITKKKGYYEVIFDADVINIHPEIMIKYHIALKKEYDIKMYHQMILDNDYLIYYGLAIGKLKKLMTRFEMKTYLLDKGASESITKRILKDLEDKRYINDLEYVKMFIALKKSTTGPKMMAYKLKQKGIDFELVDQMVNQMDQSDEINALITKKLASLSQKSNHQKLVSIKTYLLSKGFELTTIDSYLSKLTFKDSDDQKLILKDYEKLKYKYKHLTGYELKDKLYQKLYQKGYHTDLIKKVIE